MFMQHKIVQNVNKYEDLCQFCTVLHNLREVIETTVWWLSRDSQC